MSEGGIRDIGRPEFNLTLHWQLLYREIKKRLRNGDIDVNRNISDYQSLVDKAITIPTRFCIVRLWQGYRLFHKSPEGIGLWKGLSVQLVYPCLRTVSRNHHQRNMLVVSLSNSRRKIEQGRSTGNTNGYWLL